MKAAWQKHTLHFKQASGTSRGVLRSKDSYFIRLSQNGQTGIGECGLLRGLSADDRPDYTSTLDRLMQQLENEEKNLLPSLREFPSIQAGLEMALLDLKSKKHQLFPSAFTQGAATMPINGLIWMGDVAFMKKQVVQKLEQGFGVLKMKIGAIAFAEELAILQSIRKEFSPNELQLRVDANGGFSAAQAPIILQQLADLEVHSIEQPIAKGQWEAMGELCAQSPIPIALDEELIGLWDATHREEMLRTIKPQYIILKPSFVGGFAQCEKWIDLVKKHQAGWWVTSALESNVGLSAIAQWNFKQNNPVASGLGTGALYTNNFKSPLYVKQGEIGYEPNQPWQINLK